MGQQDGRPAVVQPWVWHCRSGPSSLPPPLHPSPAASCPLSPHPKASWSWAPSSGIAGGPRHRHARPAPSSTGPRPFLNVPLANGTPCPAALMEVCPALEVGGEGCVEGTSHLICTRPGGPGTLLHPVPLSGLVQPLGSPPTGMSHCQLSGLPTTSLSCGLLWSQVHRMVFWAPFLRS